jgi:hypothetical protein
MGMVSHLPNNRGCFFVTEFHVQILWGLDMPYQWSQTWLAET